MDYYEESSPFDSKLMPKAEKIIIDNNCFGDLGVSLPQALNYSKMPAPAPKVLLPPPPTVQELLEPPPPPPIYQARPVRTARTSGRELFTSNQVHPCDNQTRRRTIENSLTNVQPTLETKQIKSKRKHIICSILLLSIIVILLIVIVLALLLNKSNSIYNMIFIYLVGEVKIKLRCHSLVKI
jgi:hypothetical protein